jgi:hypothetical protein
LCQSNGGWWADVLAAFLFLLAALTLESGLIVWVVVAASRLCGLRGVSWRGVALVTILLAGYFYVRFVYLGTGAPELEDRAMGFGLGRLERTEVVSKFGDAPYLLYFYNVVSSVLSVLLSEPRGGTWEMTRRWLAGEAIPSVIVSWLSACMATGLMIWFAAVRFRGWIARRFDRDDQIVLVFLGVTAANAAISYAYTKDEIMSTAGVFYALAAFVAARFAMTRFAAVPRRALATMAMVLLLFAGSASWAIRSTGLHYHMYYSGYYLRNEWATVDQWLAEQHVEVNTPQGKQLVSALRTAAIEMPMLHPHFLPRWAERWFA